MWGKTKETKKYVVAITGIKKSGNTIKDVKTYLSPMLFSYGNDEGAKSVATTYFANNYPGYEIHEIHITEV